MDDPDVYLPVGILIVLLFILSESYGISPDGVFHSFGAIGQNIASFSLSEGLGTWIPALLVIGVLGALAIATDFGLSELAAVGLVFFFILVVA